VIIVFLGPPGSGKGTQASQLREQGFYHFDTGSMLRSEAASGSELGQRIASFIEYGKLVPLEVIKELVQKFLTGTPGERIMFDGFPRNLDQARVLDEGLAELGRKLDHALYLQMEPQTLLSRIVNRRTCPTCGAIYNMKSHAPRDDEQCDLDGTQLVQRKDDTREVFEDRLKVYLSQTVPVLDHYRDLGLLREVNADQSIEAVTEGILAQLGELDDDAAA
jgi:adenylate kinase